MTLLRIYVEGQTDVPVARKVAQLAGLDPATPVVLHGSSVLDRDLPAIKRSASPRSPVFVLRDVDPTPPNLKGKRYGQCGSVVLQKLRIPNHAPGFRFRLARHEMEAWLLADSKAFAKWLGCPEAAVPNDPDSLTKPSLEIVELAKHPRVDQALRADLVPPLGATSKFGSGFEAAISRFAAGSWSAKRARLRSRSLDHCVRALERLAKEGR